MPKKKKKKKSGGAAKAAPESTHQALILPPDREKWVTLSIKLVNWNFMDFKMRIKTSTPLFFLHKKLKERHGRMLNVKLYKKSVNEEHLMPDEFKTFEDYGVPGGPQNSAPVEYAIYYEYTPYHSNEPVILAEKIVADDGETKLPSIRGQNKTTGKMPMKMSALVQKIT